MSQKCENVDNLSILYKDLQKDIEAEKLYWVRNDAKIRAVNTSNSYDEFKNIVDAAHLTPLSKKEISSMKHTGSSTWNRALH